MRMQTESPILQALLDRRVLLPILSGISCWCFGGLCFASDAGFFHPGVAVRCLEGWANAALYIRLTGLAECHIMAVITNVAMIITMAVVIPCQAITPT
jgi:hypothetical protein